MKTKISISDFTFLSSGYGAYKVIYRSPVTLKSWAARITNIQLIDDTKNAESPKKKDLEALRRIVKRGG